MSARLLALTHVDPTNGVDGPSIRSSYILRSLSEHFDVDAVCFCRRVDMVETRGSRGLAAHHVSSLQRFPILQEQSRVRYIADHVGSVLTGVPYTSARYRNKAFAQRVDELLRRNRYQVVHVESIGLVDQLRRVPMNRVVLVHHNVESELLRAQAVDASRRYQSYLMRLHAARIEASERAYSGKVAVNVCVSELDRSRFAALCPAGRFEVLPNGVDTDYFVPERSADEQGLVFCGVLDWLPNEDAMRHFYSDVFPLLGSDRHVRMRWVGRYPKRLPGEFAACGAHLTGFVPDVRPFLRDAACVVVPLRVGSGTRLKILDAWAMGKAVVSTSIGCAGLDARDGDNLLIADSPAEFAHGVRKVLRDGPLRQSLGRAGRLTVETQYSWKVIGEAAARLYREVAAGSSAPSH